MVVFLFFRIMWIFLHLIMVCTLGAIIWNVLQDYKNTPVVTTVDSDHYPSNLLDFPGKNKSLSQSKIICNFLLRYNSMIIF
jgi:hypothetical protein